MRHSARGPALRWLDFIFDLHLNLAERCTGTVNLQIAWGPAQCISGLGNNVVSRRNHLLNSFQLQFTSTSPVFTRKNFYEKKISKEKCSLN